MAYLKRKKMEKAKLDPVTGKIMKNPATGEIVLADNTNKWTGPFANKAGEWVANHVIAYTHLLRNDVRVGKPKWYKDMASEDLERMGFQGTFLLRDVVITGDPEVFVEIDTDLLHEDVVSGQRPATKIIDPKYIIEKE